MGRQSKMECVDCIHFNVCPVTRTMNQMLLEYSSFWAKLAIPDFSHHPVYKGMQEDFLPRYCVHKKSKKE